MWSTLFSCFLILFYSPPSIVKVNFPYLLLCVQDLSKTNSRLKRQFTKQLESYLRSISFTIHYLLPAWDVICCISFIFSGNVWNTHIPSEAAESPVSPWGFSINCARKKWDFSFIYICIQNIIMEWPLCAWALCQVLETQQWRSSAVRDF